MSKINIVHAIGPLALSDQFGSPVRREVLFCITVPHGSRRAASAAGESLRTNAVPHQPIRH